MEENKYKIELRKVLDENTSDALSKINASLKLLPEKTKSIEFMIFPDQDGEGTFGVRLSLSGPDLFVLNKAIEDTADLIKVIHTPEGLKPNVPLLDPFDSNFEVNDVLCDTVGDWLKSMWHQADKENINIPVSIVSDEGYGLNFPIQLH